MDGVTSGNALLRSGRNLANYLEVGERDSLEGAALKSAAGIGCTSDLSSLDLIRTRKLIALRSGQQMKLSLSPLALNFSFRNLVDLRNLVLVISFS